MNTRLKDLLNSSSSDLFPCLLSVDSDPSDEFENGGGDHGDAELGETGEKALKAEREQRKALEKKLAQMESQLNSVKDINPEAYRAAQLKTEELQRQLLEREQLTAAERQRIETKAAEQIRKANQTAETEKAKRIDLQVRTLARGVFLAAGGRDGADAAGRSFFDAWMEFQGCRHLQVDEGKEKLFVIDSDGDRMDVDPVDWLNQQADNSPVVGLFFKAKGGEGSGGLVGARGVRGQQTRSVDELRNASPSSLLSSHYGS